MSDGQGPGPTRNDTFGGLSRLCGTNHRTLPVGSFEA